MALLVGNTPGFLPPIPDGGDTGGGELVAPVGLYVPSWIAPDGVTVLELNPTSTFGEGLFTLKAVSGLGAAPVDLVTRDSSDGGVIVENVRVKEKTILWPIRVRAGTHADFVVLWRAVVEAFTQTRRLRRPGRLRILRDTGTARDIRCWYAGGLEQDPEEGAWTELTATVQLLCPSPLWIDPEPVEKSWRQEPGDDYFDPYPMISSGAILGAATMVNEGIEPAFPSWEIRGPLTSLQATNNTRSESFTFTYSLDVGEVATISTRPIEVRGPGGVQAVSGLNLLAGGIPWRLDALATTDITFTAVGAAAETAPGAGDATQVTLRYERKYETS